MELASHQGSVVTAVVAKEPRAETRKMTARVGNEHKTRRLKLLLAYNLRTTSTDRLGHSDATGLRDVGISCIRGILFTAQDSESFAQLQYKHTDASITALRHEWRHR